MSSPIANLPLTNGIATPHLNGKIEKPTPISTPAPAERVDDNPYAQIIDSLRAQNNELFTQVTALNSKLVQSYDRVSDLEDADHLTQSTLRNANLRVAQLELERMEHLSALDTGLLVEKAHVTTELSRLMERVSEEAAQRGMAENAKHEIEKDLDDLSATLFNQANTMVAEARFARAQSEKKAAACETAMKSQEEVVALMQTQMQSLTQAREAADREAEELRELMNKGKWERKRTTSLVSSGSQIMHFPRLFNTHLPFEEFLLFVGHLRMMRPAAQQPPALTTLLSLPFMARLIVEDSDPTLRLDFAPSLNWLTRRSISSAVQQGQLQIEPMHPSQMFVEFAAHSTTATTPDIICALCGKNAVHNQDGTSSTPPPTHPALVARQALQNTAAWASTSRFFRTSLVSAPNSRSGTASSTPAIPASPSSQSHLVYVFRLSLPPPQKSQPYALCMSGWCLARLRSTCELWRFVRTGVIERVWEEEVSALPPPPPPPSTSVIAGVKTAFNLATPPVPPKRSASRVGSFWEKGLGALGVDVAGTGTGAAATSTITTHSVPPLPPPPAQKEAALPPPPPPPPRTAARKVPPPPPPRNDARTNLTASPEKAHVDIPDEHPATQKEGTVDLNDEDHMKKDTTQENTQQEPIVRPGSPLSAPLPPSAPSTPTRNLSTLPSVGGGSPAPPPLPRRAAARRVGTPAGRGSPRTSVLILGKERDGLEKRSSIDGLIMSSDAGGSPAKRNSVTLPSTSRPGTPSGGRPGSPTPLTMEPTRPLSPAPKRSSVIAVAALEETPASIPPKEADVAQANVTEVPSAPAEDTEPTVPPPPVVESEKATSALPASDGVAEHTAAPPPPLPRRRVVPPPPTEVHDEKKDDTPSAAPQEAVAEEKPEDESVWVGDRTWEERAWKELTRLKADMFWARVGSLGSSRD